MKYFFIFFLFCSTRLLAQEQTYDIVTFTLPDGWSKGEENNAAIQYVKKEGTKWAQIAIYKNTTSLGTPEADFDSEWEKLAATPYQITALPIKTAAETVFGDWKKTSGTGKWMFNGKEVITTVTTYTGYGACVSILCNRSDKKFAPAYDQLLSTIRLQSGNTVAVQDPVPPPPADNGNEQTISNTQPVATGYKFNTTNFDDGWTSTIQEDWVQVEKGSIKTMIHYPKEGTIFPSDPEPLIKAAWNILVAPRYSNLSNFNARYIETYNRPYFGTGYATENSTGQSVFIVLFRRGGGWIEVMAPDNASFTREFGFNPESIVWGKLTEYSGGWVVTNSAGTTINADPEIFNKLDNMTTYNKFAVAASDLAGTGKWNAGFSSNTYYANYYTGNYAGMNTYTSSQWFDFKSGQQYHWELVAANTFNGQTNVAQAKSDGNFSSVNDWQLNFSNIEQRSKTYDAYFTATKGGRVLWLNDANAPGSGIFTGYSK